jgi:CheY-like chemotaxis protein
MSVRNSSSPKPQARILLVDDNAHGLTARKAVLEEVGHKITTAASGQEALEHFARQKFDLVVTDYRMPRMDGLELIGHVRKQAPAVPVILLSGFVDTLGLNEDNTGADAVIQKSSHEVSHLLRVVARLLNRKPAKKPAAAAGKPSSRGKATRKGAGAG